MLLLPSLPSFLSLDCPVIAPGSLLIYTDNDRDPDRDRDNDHDNDPDRDRDPDPDNDHDRDRDPDPDNDPDRDRDNDHDNDPDRDNDRFALRGCMSDLLICFDVGDTDVHAAAYFLLIREALLCPWASLVDDGGVLQ